MIKNLITMALCVGALSLAGQDNYSIRHNVNYIRKDLLYIYMYYESNETFTTMSVIHNRISHYCDSYSLNYIADSIPVEIRSTSKDMDTLILDSFNNLYFVDIEGYDVIYCSIFKDRIIVSNKGRLELFLHDTMQYPQTQIKLTLSGDTIDVQSKNDLYVHFLHFNLDKIKTNDMKIIADTMMFSDYTVDMTDVKYNVRADYLLFYSIFVLRKSEITAFKKAVRKIYFKNYNKPTEELSDYDDMFVDFRDINGFLKRRMWISRFHLLFVKRKFKH